MQFTYGMTILPLSHEFGKLCRNEFLRSHEKNSTSFFKKMVKDTLLNLIIVKKTSIDFFCCYKASLNQMWKHTISSAWLWWSLALNGPYQHIYELHLLDDWLRFLCFQLLNVEKMKKWWTRCMVLVNLLLICNYYYVTQWMLHLV